MSEEINKYHNQVVCRGCKALGTACGKCAKCLDDNNGQTIYQRALTKFGVDNQLKKLSQELLELGLALSHMEEGRHDHNVQEEFADVEIMMGQLREKLNDSGVIDEWKRVKTLRLEGLL